jgi:quinol---cytochrome c reductase cytochrome c subunit, bacillus type
MSEPNPPKFAAQFDSDSRRTPIRVAFVTRRTSPQVKTQEDSLVMTFPEGLFRAAVAIEILAVVLVLVSLIFNAPLEELADPMHTPNPAKAPWYFLGLQELLHYFPPFVAGVLIPTLVVLALIVIPYFDINVESEGVWLRNREPRLRFFVAVLAVLTAVMLTFHVYAVLIPSLLIGALMLLAAGSSPESPSHFRRWLVSKPLSYWIMTWFLVQAGILTVIGTFFRGAGWSWVWPWRS